MWKLKTLIEWSKSNQTEIKGKWVPARPYRVYNIFHRIYYAWLVIIGKADTFVWPEEQ